MKKKPIDTRLFDGIIIPGETYLLHIERESWPDAGPIKNLYTVRSAEELEAALELEVDTLLGQQFEFREFLEVRRLDNGRYMLRLRCHHKQERRDAPFHFFLHRIPGAVEMLRQTKERLDLAGGF